MCDTLCVRTGDAMFFAKNSDRHPDEIQTVRWYERRAPGSALRTQYLTLDDPGAYAFLGSQPTWLWGVEDGVNEFGVAVGNEKIWTVDNPKERPAALLGMDLVRLALERARSAGEAMAVITTLVERHGQGGSGEPHRAEPYDSSFLVADADGACVIETSNRVWVAREVTAGAALSNRISMGTDWTRASSDIAAGTDFDDYRWKRMPTAIADGRLAVTTAAVTRGAATAAQIARTMRSHGHPDNDRTTGDNELPGAADADGRGFTVCMHRRDLHSQTTGSIVAELRRAAPPRSWVCLGNPCCGVYVPTFASAPGVAPELGDASQWERFARLRDRVEASPERLLEVRTELETVEAELWARAQTAYDSGEPSQLDTFARTAYAPVDAALHRLGV